MSRRSLRSPAATSSRLAATAITFLIALPGAGQSPGATDRPVAHLPRPRLAPGTPVEGELKAGAVDTHRLRVEVGQYVHLTVEPRDVSPVATLLDPSGKVVAAAQDPDGGDAPLRLSAIAERSGIYQLRLTVSGTGGSGHYRLTLDPPRSATEEDQGRVRAERAYAEGVRLALQGTAESGREAVKRYQEAREIWRGTHDDREQAEALTAMGGLQFGQGAVKEALAGVQEALSLYQSAHDLRGEAITLNNLGTASWSLGDLKAALEYYERALPIVRQLGLVRVEAMVLSNIGSVHRNRGDPRQALEFYERSLPLRRQARDLSGEATSLSNIGVAQRMLGDRRAALSAYEEALPLARASKDTAAETVVLQNLGALSLSVGDVDRGLETLERALELSRRAGDRSGEAFVLGRLAQVQYLKGDYTQAIALQQRELELRRAMGDRYAEGNDLAYLGFLYRLKGEPAAAEENLSAALRLQSELGDRYDQTYTLLEIGSLRQDAGDLAAAQENYAQALASSRSLSDPGAEATALFRISRLRRAQGELDEALRSVEAAVALLESLRARVAGPRSRASFFVSAQDAYELQIDLLMTMDAARPGQGLSGQALQASERKRARSLLDLLAESGADVLRDVDPEQRRQAAFLRDRLSARTQQQSRLLAGRHTEDEAAAIAREIQELVDQYDQVERKLRADSVAYGALQGEAAGAIEVQRLLDDRTVLLEFSLGEKVSYAWAITREAVHAVRLAPRQEITAAARAFHDGLASAPSPRGDAGGRDAGGAELSRLLLEPLAAYLNRERVVIVADGSLHYVPFAALPEPLGSGAEVDARGARPPLVAHHEVVFLPSATALALLRSNPPVRKANRGTVAVLADPVFEADDPRVRPKRRSPHSALRSKAEPAAASDLLRAARDVRLGGAGSRFPRLPYSRQEADAIAAAAAPGSILRALDFEASRTTALSPQLAGYRIVHFATHGFVDDERPDLSGLVLSLVDRSGRPQDGFLRLRDVYSLRLPVELVVLSGCRTGLGKEVRGEGLLGIVRGFMYAGTPRVAASLWDVDDRATAILMKEFYQAMLVSDRSPAAALRQAQLAVRSHERWRDPFYWAAFVVHGEWN